MTMELFDFHIYENIKKCSFFDKIWGLLSIEVLAINVHFTAI